MRSARRIGGRLAACALALTAIGGSQRAQVRAMLAWDFTGQAEGGGPNGTLITDPVSGAMYGVAYGGGTGYGTVYSLVHGAGGWTVAALYTFTGGDDGGAPVGQLIEDANGNLYGVTGGAGAGRSGTVFELMPPSGSQTAWQIQVLYTFMHGEDGGVPAAGLIADAGGNLYGTTSRYGDHKWGTVFTLSPPAGGATVWNFRTIHNFTGGADGGTPLTSMLIDAAGNLYGTTSRGGKTSIGGTVFELSPPAHASGGWTEKTIWQFSGTNGAYVSSALIADKSGALYGTAPFGGSTGQGVVFQLAPPAAQGDPWTENILWNFSIDSGSAYPFGGLIADSEGNLYGATFGYLCGNFVAATSSIYVLSPPTESGQPWSETKLTQVKQGIGFNMKETLSAGGSGTLIATAVEISKRGEQGDAYPKGSIVEIIHTGFE